MCVTILPDPSTGHTNYPAVDVASIHHIAVFPPLGISRVGDSLECFLAPEVPDHTSPPKGPDGKEYMFRDAHQKLRRQAVRFRVYAYDANNKILGELNKKNDYTLTWTVNVANKKPAYYEIPNQYPPTRLTLRNKTVKPDLHPDKRDPLIIKANGTIPPTPQAGFVNLQGEFYGSKSTAVKVDLAQLQLDDAGRLVFIPGKGDSRSVADPQNPHPPTQNLFNNPDWFDEICDGKVEVKVTGNNIPANIPVLGAWVLSGPPNFAWGINIATSLYDIMEDMYHQAGNQHVPAPTKANLDFWAHIWPVLQSAALVSWTNDTALRGHGPSKRGHYDADELFQRFKGATADPGQREERKRFKTTIFGRLRRRLDNGEPDPDQTGSRYMPLLSGTAAITRLQYERFRIWKDDDDFHLTGDGPPVLQPKLETLPLANQPEDLTRAILESTVGDTFNPGIEMYLIAKWRDLYNITETTIKPPFRINSPVLPGHLTQALSLPWQTDFDACGSNWWPAVRPTRVTLRSKGSDGLANRREDWKRGVPPSVGGGNDMVEHWAQFGVVREVKSGGNSEFLEDEHVVRA